VRVLLDQGAPAPLRRALVDHHVATAYEKGWARLTNGELLAAAEGSFDVFVTTDQSLRYQQNLVGQPSSFSQRPAGRDSSPMSLPSPRLWPACAQAS
jgi:hypothetical protein